MLHAVGSAARTAGEAVKVESGIVGEGIGLEPRPEVLDGVEFRSVGRQVFQMSRTGQYALLEQLALVSLEAVPDENNRCAQLVLQMLKEVHGDLGIDVGIRVQTEVQRESVAGGRDADGC